MRFFVLLVEFVSLIIITGISVGLLFAAAIILNIIFF